MTTTSRSAVEVQAGPRTDGRAMEIVEALMRERPQFHQTQIHEKVNHALGDRVLYWIARHVSAGLRTLETGCGYSTAAFVAAGAAHTAIAPAAVEFERLSAWCRGHGLDLSGTRLINGFSERVLPGLDTGPLDVVLVDGNHAFPFPFIDWYYVQGALRRGGLVLLDDTHCRAVRVLVDFLDGEAGRWKRVDKFDRTVAFEKVCDDAFEGIFWRRQPWGGTPVRSPVERVRHGLFRVAARTVRLSPALTRMVKPIYRERFVKGSTKS